ncbi:hypothetical protein A2721_00400 [Candidatus Gottesmanbacteria bacterium RIFCSPHIGHO2_01_FULL_47_48]|uniref:Uncharacterized protein n=1 Tax=Candidatus Gottesmanbacteria bacterium RIFCSPHIGHO2_01_FULL_47_48 TaxID=1798381 RepID=A0A1F6A1N8_9BACT|nr:MAG: hypothetical protein A2721_00400 [Candidatus Gottesmanbacteria bacterium RIFCSPHIGHO2_01_FULL_47_48]
MRDKITKDKIFRTTPKVKYLNALLGRLETEYIPVLNLIIKHNSENERSIGFWSLMRIIFPVIETVATVIGKKKEDFLEQDLHVPFGHIVWEIYRHSLMHTDELRYAVYKGKTISWGAHISIEGTGHFIRRHTKLHPTTIHLDISELYFSLQKFIKNEVVKNDETPINIQVGIHFPDQESKLQKDLEELYTNY